MTHTHTFALQVVMMVFTSSFSFHLVTVQLHSFELSSLGASLFRAQLTVLLPQVDLDPPLLDWNLG